ncbi:MAG: TlpA disulfide reductase family protein [Sphingomicrobium sp.]
MEIVLRLILLFLALLGPLFATAACDRQKPQRQQGEAAQAGPVKGVHRENGGKAAPDVTFQDPDGGDIRLADFKGVPVLVNLWASWCGPCVKELPTLEKLSDSHLQDGQLGVIAVSQDMAPHSSVTAFLAEHKIDGLGAYQDPKMALSGALGVEVLPTSILYDNQGREIWRYVGDLDWTSAEASKLLAEAGVAQTR